MVIYFKTNAKDSACDSKWLLQVVRSQCKTSGEDKVASDSDTRALYVVTGRLKLFNSDNVVATLVAIRISTGKYWYFGTILGKALARVWIVKGIRLMTGCDVMQMHFIRIVLEIFSKLGHPRIVD